MPDKSRIPEYYRHLAESKGPAARPPEPEPPAEATAPTPVVPPPAQPKKAIQPPAPGLPSPETPIPEVLAEPSYRAQAFALALPEDGWTDQSVYVLAGPVSDGLQHNVTVTLDPDVPNGLPLDAYAGLQLDSLRGELRGCRILLQDTVPLDCGLPARRVVFRWEPSEAVRVYQEQLYVLDERMGYKLTATFTRKTRKTLGPAIERILRSFAPRPRNA